MKTLQQNESRSDSNGFTESENITIKSLRKKERMYIKWSSSCVALKKKALGKEKF